MLNMEDSRTLEEELVQEHGLFFSVLFIFCVFFGIFVGFFVSWFNLIYIALHKVSSLWQRQHRLHYVNLHVTYFIARVRGTLRWLCLNQMYWQQVITILFPREI
jgi:hypothetical protein